NRAHLTRNFVQLSRANVFQRNVPSANLKRKNRVPTLSPVPVTFPHNQLAGLTVCEPRGASKLHPFFDALQDRKDHRRYLIAVRPQNEFDRGQQQKCPSPRPALAPSAFRSSR